VCQLFHTRKIQKFLCCFDEVSLVGLSFPFPGSSGSAFCAQPPRTQKVRRRLTNTYKKTVKIKGSGSKQDDTETRGLKLEIAMKNDNTNETIFLNKIKSNQSSESYTFWSQNSSFRIPLCNCFRWCTADHVCFSCAARAQTPTWVTRWQVRRARPRTTCVRARAFCSLHLTKMMKENDLELSAFLLLLSFSSSPSVTASPLLVSFRGTLLPHLKRMITWHQHFGGYLCIYPHKWPMGIMFEKNKMGKIFLWFKNRFLSSWSPPWGSLSIEVYPGRVHTLFSTCK